MTAPATKPCPFCHLDPHRIVAEDEIAVAYRDGFPVSLGHTVIIPRRHFATLFDATEAEQSALLRMLAQARDILDKLHQPDGYNIGINHGQAGGQTVPHLHIHLIPRYRGDRKTRAAACAGCCRTRRSIGRRPWQPTRLGPAGPNMQDNEKQYPHNKGKEDD